VSKKAKIIGLIIVIVVVWAKVIIDLFKYKQPEQVYVPMSNDKVTETTLDEKFNYELMLDYKDPFLEKSTRRKISNQSQVTRTKPKKKTLVNRDNNIKWPLVKYVGNVLGVNTHQETISMKINGKEFSFMEKETHEGVSLLALYPDSIQISFKEQLKTLKR